MSSGKVIDYTTEVLTRRLYTYMKNEDYETAQVMSTLLEGYLDGLWIVNFRDGEPYFTLTDETLVNDVKFDEAAQLSFDWYETAEGHEEDPYKGPLDD